MPKVTHLQTNFTAGELSPKLFGRVDISRYQNGAEKVRDLIVQVYGGVKRRDGSLFVVEVKDSAKRTRLVPFIKDADTSYELEFGDLYMRVLKNGVQVESSPGVPYEVVSPYTEAQLFDFDYTQGADTMFLFHQAVAPHRLVCAGDTSWTLAAATFIEVPFENPGTYPTSNLTPSVATPLGESTTLTASVPGTFVVGDVGSFVKVNGGIVKITGWTDSQHVSGVIKQELANTALAPEDAWSLHAPAWSASRGYPRTGTLYEQRLVAAGSPSFPQTIWGSVTGAYLDFTQGTEDSDAFDFTIATDIANPIRYVASNRSLLALTSAGEFTIEGGTERPLAPTNARIRSRSNYGCAQVRPVRIRDSELFVQKAGRKVRCFAYSIANDDWVGPDLSVLAEHMTEGGVADMAWQQELDSIVWLARADGMLASITLDRDQEVTGWSLHEEFSHTRDADGELGDQHAWVESVICTPGADTDNVTMVVKRLIGGAEVRYIERLSLASTTDCAIIASGAATDTWDGLDHLEGETVHAVGDGVYLGSYQVAGGEVTLTRECEEVNIGRNFRPLLKLLPPEIQTGMGSSSGNAMRTSEVTARFFETTGCHVNGKPLTFTKTGVEVLDQPPELFTGIKRIENLGFERGVSDLEFTQEQPMPFHILSVTRKFTVNEG